MLGVLEELADDGARRVDLRTGLGLVRGGWATRWRHRPPWHRFVLYRLGIARLPEQHRWWAARDIEGRLFPLRELGPNIVMLVFLVALPYLWGPGRASFTVVSLLPVLAYAGLAFLPAVDRRLRRLAREREFAVRAPLGAVTDRPLVLPSGAERIEPRRRLAAYPGLGRAAVVLAAGAVALPAAAVLAPKRIAMIPCEAVGTGWCAESVVIAREPQVGGALVVWLALAAVVGVVLAVLAARRVRQVDLPPQSHRELVGTRVPWGSLTAGVAFAAIGVAEATGALVQLFAAPLAFGCVVALGAVVGQRVGLRSRMDAASWAVIDAWRATFSRSGSLPVDPPRREVLVDTGPPELAGSAG